MTSSGQIVQQMRQQVSAQGLLAPTQPVVVMLSGGRDSVCLLDVAVHICTAAYVSALHVNYQLRPQADEDERYCRQLCGRLGVQLRVLRVEYRQGNLQAWAREVRYQAAAELAAQGEALIAVGHTCTDQVETILYRLAASPGRRALLGMAVSERGIVRPLLQFSREQTASYCSERGLKWREDPSNDSELYARGRVRGALVGALQAIHPAAMANVLRTAELLREETELLDRLVEAELAGRQSIAVQRLRQLPVALARMVVVRLAEQTAGVLVPQAGARLQEILELAERGAGAQLHLGRQVAAVIENDTLRMIKLAPRHPPRRRQPEDG
jgi:tRNA(Ile)-lysidine synthase